MGARSSFGVVLVRRSRASRDFSDKASLFLALLPRLAAITLDEASIAPADELPCCSDLPVAMLGTVFPSEGRRAHESTVACTICEHSDDTWCPIDRKSRHVNHLQHLVVQLNVGKVLLMRNAASCAFPYRYVALVE